MQKNLQWIFLDRKWPPLPLRKFSGNSSIFETTGFPSFWIFFKPCLSDIFSYASRGILVRLVIHPFWGSIFEFSSSNYLYGVSSTGSDPHLWKNYGTSLNFWLKNFLCQISDIVVPVKHSQFYGYLHFLCPIFYLGSLYEPHMNPIMFMHL